jgi:transcription initiation factor TFIIIB Brf1 subunit/transcription initiation factor TFIIB
MSKIAYKLNLPRNVIETSSMIYRRAIQKQLIRGRTIQSVAVASIYMACRQCNVIRTLEDVARRQHHEEGSGSVITGSYCGASAEVPQVDPLLHQQDRE